MQKMRAAGALLLLLGSASATYHAAPRRLLQVTTDSIDFSVLIVSNETNATQEAILRANLTMEGFSSASPPVATLATCPENSISPEGSVAVTQCTCLPGFQGNASNGTGCTPCPRDTFCASGSLGLCPANANAPALSDSVQDCACNPGFTGDGAVSCRQCPPDAFCAGGSALEACTPGAVSPAQSSAGAACYCDRGYYGVGNSPCVRCEPGSWCWTGVKNQCSANRGSASGSTRSSDCICLDGFVDVAVIDNANQSTRVCTTCPADSFCKVFDSRIPVYNARPRPPSNAPPTCNKCPGPARILPMRLPCRHYLHRRPDLPRWHHV